MATKKIIIVQANQSIFDIALLEYGSVEGVFDLIIDNELEGINANLDPGDELVVSSDKIINKDVVAYYSRTGRKPATVDQEVGDDDDDEAFTTGFTLGFES